MTYGEIIKKIKSWGSQRNIMGMARFGIRPKTKVCGVSTEKLRKLAKEIGKNHELALQLWQSGIHEARLLAAFVDDPSKVTFSQMRKWIKSFDSWDICDQTCSSLFDKTPWAWQEAKSLTKEKAEYVKRTGFVLMACLAVHDKKAKDNDFVSFFPLIKKEAIDERNFVKKAVNWAIRQIGKRNLNLNRQAIKLSLEIKKMDSKSARWIASGALSELGSEAVQKRLKEQSNKMRK